MKRIGFWMLDHLVPTWFRSRWPLRRFYWQQKDIDEAKRLIDELRDTMDPL